MGLFNTSQLDSINAVAAKSKEVLEPPKVVKAKSINDDLNAMSEQVMEYFKDSEAILITTEEDLHNYVSKCLEVGYAGIDTETTGLDRIKDHIVGASLYTPSMPECYIPMKHLVPIFDTPYKGQLTYEQVGKEFQRFADEKSCKLIFANADFDLAMIYNWLKVDLNDAFYYDVILAWRCLKENEKDNALKVLYNKYVLKGKGHPMKFQDFFSVKLFPYSKPEVAMLYAANDAKITYELFKWQLPYVTVDHPKCKKAHLEAVAELVWNVEMPMVKVCQNMNRTGIYLDKDTASVLVDRYKSQEENEKRKLSEMIDDMIANSSYSSFSSDRPFRSGKDFNPKSTLHVKYLVYKMMNVTPGKDGQTTDKSFLHELNQPVTNQILKVRSLGVLISTFVDKMPKATTPDSRIHAEFRQIGADTGRMSSSNPNLQNIPSHATDIRHMFRATPGYVMLSSDYSQQEPKITAFVSQDPKMIDAFKKGRDIYSTIASLAFNKSYEDCLEFHPETHEYQPEGKARRGEAKTILLGLTYGRSVPSIAEQLYGTRDDMSEEDKVKGAQKIYDSVLNAFPDLRKAMLASQNSARSRGYTETILGRRRHLPDMQLKEFEFVPMKGYVNPDIDPLDPETLKDKSAIPERIVRQLEQEFKSYKYFGQIARRTRELYDDEKIRVINNRPKINDATRQCLNGVIQGSAADMTKLAILRLENNDEWKRIGGRLLVPVHDELICEVPIDRYEDGARILEECMCGAADFLPFPITCDVTTSLRWYGLEYPCKYTKPSSLSNISEDEVKWVQYQLCELEYPLPVLKEADGSKPRGDAASGVNGVVTDEYLSFIDHYKNRYNITSDIDFINHIEKKVIKGVVA